MLDERPSFVVAVDLLRRMDQAVRVKKRAGMYTSEADVASDYEAERDSVLRILNAFPTAHHTDKSAVLWEFIDDWMHCRLFETIFPKEESKMNKQNPVYPEKEIVDLSEQFLTDFTASDFTSMEESK